MAEQRPPRTDFVEYTAATLNPTEVVVHCIENGAPAILVDRESLSPDFFDLSSGVAGALVQKLTNYGIRMACVVPDPTQHSAPFQDFAREANRGELFHFAPTREAAIDWLQVQSKWR